MYTDEEYKRYINNPDNEDSDVAQVTNKNLTRTCVPPIPQSSSDLSDLDNNEITLVQKKTKEETVKINSNTQIKPMSRPDGY